MVVEKIVDLLKDALMKVRGTVRSAGHDCSLTNNVINNSIRIDDDGWKLWTPLMNGRTVDEPV